MHRIGGLLAAPATVALALALSAAPLGAQSANDWRLPGATVRPAPPGSQGPVDRDNPVVTTTAPRPEPAVTPASVSPTIETTPAPANSPAPAARSTPESRRAAAAPQPTGTAAAPAMSPPASTAGSAASPGAIVIPTLAALPPAAPPLAAAEPAGNGWLWPGIAGAMALLAAAFAALWWRRRKDGGMAPIAFERPAVPAPETAPAPARKPAPAARQAAPLPEPRLAIVLPGGLAVTLEARRMSASLMATTLNYVLTLTNSGSEPLLALAVEGDMISAHASLPPEAQIANDNQRLEPRHALVTLAPGESVEFTGDFRLPLAAVTPIRAGAAAYFVPLARLRIEARTASGSAVVQAQTWVVGDLPDDPQAALRPFRLDLGPRVYARIGQRAVG